MAQIKIDGLTCDRCPTKIALDEFDLRNKGLPEGWLKLTRDIYLCPDCVTAVRAVLAPPSNGKSAIENINRRRVPARG